MNGPPLDNSVFSIEEKMNFLGKNRVPFLFVISYDKKKGTVLPLSKIPPDILYDVNGIRNFKEKKKVTGGSVGSRNPVPFHIYRTAFDSIIDEIVQGNSYVANLTFPTEIHPDISLENIFMKARAPFRLLYQDRFVTFSPERFVSISGTRINTFPMKGTIDASLSGAEKKIINDEKEMAEHVMIVDLLRNDLSMVARNVQVDRFRYTDKIITSGGPLLQISSEISGSLDTNWHQSIGTLMMTLLPAGSITGAPKKSTVEILQRVEQDNRGFYTGVFGVFTGTGLDSAVMIRFIEKEKETARFKSGGGITIDSNPEDEYRELLQKVYLPF